MSRYQSNSRPSGVFHCGLCKKWHADVDRHESRVNGRVVCVGCVCSEKGCSNVPEPSVPQNKLCDDCAREKDQS